MSEQFDAHVALLDALAARNYRFTTSTPSTHARQIARRERARDLRDVFGWSLPFGPDTVDEDIVALLAKLDALEPHGRLKKSRLRVSSLDDMLFLHSAYPTTQQDAVFFGPDSYRFAAFLRTELPRLAPPKALVDIGAGSGVGAIVAARCVEPQTIWMNDINPKALELAMANAWFARTKGAVFYSDADSIASLAGRIDCIIANPPYIADPAHRTYRDGGAMHGGELSLRWAQDAAQKLTSGGAFVLYTGSAIVDGQDRLKRALLDVLAGFEVTYRELDPDVFGEELERKDYSEVERIAVVGLVAVKR